MTALHGLKRRAWLAGAAALLLVTSLGAQQSSAPDKSRSNDPFRFQSGIEYINVTATVSDASGRFVAGLSKDDFLVYEDDQPVEITHFSAERVPVSLGVVLDTSGSMAGDKIREAEAALDKFVEDLLNHGDEMFLFKFSNTPVLVQGWTSDRQQIWRALGRVTASGGTAMYDAVLDAVPLASNGQNQKKALVIISDGNDTSSRAGIREVKQAIRESEVLVYAVGIDSEDEAPRRPSVQAPPPRGPIPIPLPFPGFPRGGGRFPLRALDPQFIGPGGRQPRYGNRGDDRVNVAALRDMTDDSGGRTEIIRSARDLDPATTGIANELSKQYYFGYPSTGKKDGKWHSIRVELKHSAYRVRARRGYIAS
jgi:Ca-activated chloride channel family protein